MSKIICIRPKIRKIVVLYSTLHNRSQVDEGQPQQLGQSRTSPPTPTPTPTSNRSQGRLVSFISDRRIPALSISQGLLSSSPCLSTHSPGHVYSGPSMYTILSTFAYLGQVKMSSFLISGEQGLGSALWKLNLEHTKHRPYSRTKWHILLGTLSRSVSEAISALEGT